MRRAIRRSSRSASRRSRVRVAWPRAGPGLPRLPRAAGPGGHGRSRSPTTAGRHIPSSSRPEGVPPLARGHRSAGSGGPVASVMASVALLGLLQSERVIGPGAERQFGCAQVRPLQVGASRGCVQPSGQRSTALVPRMLPGLLSCARRSSPCAGQGEPGRAEGRVEAAADGALQRASMRGLR
jgi:hypothetical protein